ncbi:hypothetical protein Rhe02_97060 [Rhizocola hellebori]|uniref:Uncharacterized protein n=1 Tax=Rhizocola hellebori TaxID=1392758 RepID=A0A8J3QIB4_9ACTN|nr:hypothetical protein [Rhizocola hellebori]GIH11639.1 hypothetical protein Rhe02_97060 [Rhizocola hellebori]
MSTSDALRVAVAKWEGLGFPDHADGEDLEAWLMDLLQTDGYIAGIASTVLNGGHHHGRLDEQTSLSQRLAEISADTLHDQKVVAASREYLKALREVVAALNAYTGRHG